LLTKGLQFLEEPDWFNEVPGYIINDIGDVFNWQFMFNWKIPDPLDYLQGNTPLSYDKEMLNDLKNSLRRHLPLRKSFERVYESEVLMQQTSSTNINPKTFEKEKNWILRGSYNSFGNDGIKGFRSLTQTAVGQLRDSVLLPIDQLNSINLIDKQVYEIIQHMYGNNMVKDYGEFNKKLNHDRNKFSYFLCRDIKKEGITKPREIVKAMLEVLDEEYPDLKLGNYSGVYNSFTLSVDGKEIEMIRGHGLGMANSLTTLMQLAVFYLTVDRLSDQMNLEKKHIGCGSFNDDNYIAAVNEDILNFYWDEEEYVFNGLGLIREPTKSFKGTDFVLCETYSENLSYKESYSRREVLGALCCSNIVAAKSLISSLSRSFNYDLLNFYINEIISYWGYEFHPSEVNMSSRCGGWLNFTGRGVSFEIVNQEYNPYLKSFLEAGKITTLRKDKFKNRYPESYCPPVTKLFGITNMPHEEANLLFNIGDPKKLGKRFIRTSENKARNKSAYADLLNRRKTIFGKFIDERINLYEFEKGLIDSYPTIDFIPLETSRGYGELIPQPFELKDAIKGFKSANPKLAYLKKFFPDNIKEDVYPNPIPFLLGMRSINISETSEKRKLREEQFSSRSSIDFEELNKFSFKVTNNLENYYLNPRIVLALCANRYYNKFPIPGYKSENKKSIIELSKEIFIPDDNLLYTHKLSFPEQKIVFDELGEQIEDYSLQIGNVINRINDEFKQVIEENNKIINDSESDSDSDYEEDTKVRDKYHDTSEDWENLDMNEKYIICTQDYSKTFLTPFWNDVRDYITNRRIFGIITKSPLFENERKFIHTSEYIIEKLKTHGVKTEFSTSDVDSQTSDEEEFPDLWDELENMI